MRNIPQTPFCKHVYFSISFITLVAAMPVKFLATLEKSDLFAETLGIFHPLQFVEAVANIVDLQHCCLSITLELQIFL